MAYCLQEFLESGIFQSFSKSYFSLHCYIAMSKIFLLSLLLFSTIFLHYKKNHQQDRLHISHIIFCSIFFFSEEPWISLAVYLCHWHTVAFIGSVDFFINSNHIQDFNIKSKLLLCTFVLFVASTNLHFINLFGFFYFFYCL